MLEKSEVKTIALDSYRGSEEDLEDTIEEMKTYEKTYENDQVTVLEVKETNYSGNDRKQYMITLQVERDLNNLGRLYEYEEEKLFGFDEDVD